MILQGFEMTELNKIPEEFEIFIPTVRLTIMILLYNHQKVTFTELQRLLNLTPGNLDHHLKKLENSNSIRMYKKIFPQRPLTVIEITETGKKSFHEYITILKGILNQIDTNQ
ncbi:MAG: transcriptional regulator [Promethearchaeota archaeon]